MSRALILLAASVAALTVAGCSSGSTTRTDPFVGEWGSTGGAQIRMRVDAPTDGEYPVQISGVGVSLSAEETGDKVHEAESTNAVWTFRMVDDDLLNATGRARRQRPPVSSGSAAEGSRQGEIALVGRGDLTQPQPLRESVQLR